MRLITRAAVILAVSALLLPAAASAQLSGPWDEMTTVTFSGPVEIPGLVLPAGTYIFRLADRSSNRRAVQVLSADRQHIYAMLEGIDHPRSENWNDQPVVFNERASGAPLAIQTWYFPWDPLGLEFRYPRPQAVSIAERSHQPVLVEDGSHVQ